MLENENIYKPAGPKYELFVTMFGYRRKPLAFLACFGKRFTGCQSSHAPAQPVEKCIEEFSGNRASIDL